MAKTEPNIHGTQASRGRVYGKQESLIRIGIPQMLSGFNLDVPPGYGEFALPSSGPNFDA